MSMRQKLRENATLAKLYGAVIVAVLTSMVAWNQLGWPTPAWSDDLARVESALVRGIEAVEQRVASVEQLNLDTRALLMSDQWERLFHKIQAMEAKATLTGAQRELLAEWRIKKWRIEQQLDQLTPTELTQ